MNKNIEVFKRSISSIDIIKELKVIDVEKDEKLTGIRGLFKADGITYTYCFIMFELYSIIGLNLKFNFDITKSKKIIEKDLLEVTNEVNKELVCVKSVFLESNKDCLKIEFSHETLIPNTIDTETLSGIVEQNIRSLSYGPITYSNQLSEHDINHDKIHR